MRYHYEKPTIYSSLYGKRHICEHLVYDSRTLYKIGQRGLAVIQQRFDLETKATRWTEIDPWLTGTLYLRPGFKAFFDERARTSTDRLYPTVTVRQIMWALKLKPLKKNAGRLSLIGEIFRRVDYNILYEETKYLHKGDFVMLYGVACIVCFIGYKLVNAIAKEDEKKYEAMGFEKV